MSTFEILILVLVAIFVIVNVYIAISGRILNIKQSKIDNERAEKQMDVEKQVEALSLKCYEFQSENLKLSNEIRDWVKNYNQMTVAYNAMQKERDELKREVESLKKKKPIKKESTPPKDDKHVENYTEGD